MRALRPVLCAVLAASVAHGALSVRRTLAEAGLQRWGELGLEWLTWQRLAAMHPWKQTLAAAAVGVLLGVVLEILSAGGRRETAERAARVLGAPVLAALAALAAFGLPPALARATRPSPPPASPNLLFVLIDTWRADHAGFLGYERAVSPRLDALVERGVVFENALAQSGWTKPSVATLLTGLLPSEHRAISQPQLGLRVRGINLPPGATTLVEILAGHGWDTGMWSNNPNILPERGFAQGASHFVDYFHQRREGFDAGRSEHMLPDVERWLAERGERPFCAYVHVMDPHYPYVAPEPFAGTFAEALGEGESGFQLEGGLIQEYRCGERDLASITPEMVERLIDIYDEELLYVDHHVGGFLERFLEEHPNTVVVVVGDHGEEFLEHGQLGHSHSLHRELTHVPLVLWAPGLEPGRVDSQVRLLDVLPTLLELVGLGGALPRGARGESLLPLIEGSERGHRAAPMETGGDERPAWHWRAISDGELKLLRRERDLPTTRPLPPLGPRDLEGERPYSLLYSLADDPGETRDLAAEHPDEVERLFELMRERGWYFPPERTLALPALDAALDEDDAEALGHLGYGAH